MAIPTSERVRLRIHSPPTARVEGASVNTSSMANFPMTYFNHSPTGSGPPGSADPPGHPPGDPSRRGPPGPEPPGRGDPNQRTGSPPDLLDAFRESGRREREHFLNG